MKTKTKLTKLAFIHFCVFSALWEYDRAFAYCKATEIVNRLIRNKLVRGKKMEA